MSPSGGRHHRRRILTQPDYQWKVTYLILGVLLGFMLLSMLLVFSALTSTLRALDLWDQALTATILGQVAWMLTVELLLVVPLLVWLGLWITHKVVGPVGRIKYALEQIGRGNYTVRLTLRKGDVLMELADSINRLSDSMQRR